MNKGMQHSEERCGRQSEASSHGLPFVLHEQCPKCNKYAHYLYATKSRRAWSCCCGRKFTTIREDKRLIIPFGRRMWPAKRYKEHLSRGEKWCAKCKQWLPLANFSTNTYNSVKKAAYCRPCSTERNRDYLAQYYLKNKARLAPGNRLSAIASYKNKKEQNRLETAPM